MNTLRQAAQQVLEAWGNPMKDLCVEMDALREALEQPEQQPMAWVDQSGIDWLTSSKRGPTAYLKTTISKRKDGLSTVPLYTTPPAAQRKPLTISEILNLMPASIPSEHDGALMEFARAIEAAHGIKEGT